MAYESDELLTETPLQSSRASAYDMPNVEVDDNEINIRFETRGNAWDGE